MYDPVAASGIASAVWYTNPSPTDSTQGGTGVPPHSGTLIAFAVSWTVSCRERFTSEVGPQILNLSRLGRSVRMSWGTPSMVISNSISGVNLSLQETVQDTAGW